MKDAAETIQAAIDKLTQLRDQSSSSGARWSTSGIRITFEDNGQHFAMFEMANWGTRMDRDLVLALHATIDAQLELLRHTLDFVNSTRGATSHEGPVIDLALAILGEQATDD